MPSYKTKAVILKSYNLGEADKIIKLFSRENGIIDSVAKGARKIKSKFGGRLELFNFVELEISKGRSLDIINQAELVKNFKYISSDFNKFLFCQLISDIILKTHFSANEATSMIFKLVYVCFDKINNITTGRIDDVKKIGAFFIAKFLKITGYIPLMENCCNCSRSLASFKIINDAGPQSLYFSIKLGGTLCRSCASVIENLPDSKVLLAGRQYELLYLLFSSSLENYIGYDINPEDLNSIYKILEEYIKFHTEYKGSISVYMARIIP